MQLCTNLKLGEVNNLSDARYAAGIGAQFLGFNMTPGHPQYIAPDKIQEITGWLSGPNLVAEWDGGLSEIIRDTCERLALDYVQLNTFDPKLSSELRDLSLIQNITLAGDEKPSEIIAQANAVHQTDMFFMFSFDTEADQENYLSKAGNRLMLTEFCRNYPVLLNFFFSPGNVIDMLEDFKPFGINLKGSSEIKPGYKDFDALNDLVDVLETEF